MASVDIPYFYEANKKVAYKMTKEDKVKYGKSKKNKKLICGK